MKYRYKTETVTLTWIKVQDNLPQTGENIYFQLLGSKEIKEGFLLRAGQYKLFYADSLNYKLSEVDYWCYTPQLKGVK